MKKQEFEVREIHTDGHVSYFCFSAKSIRGAKILAKKYRGSQNSDLQVMWRDVQVASMYSNKWQGGRDDEIGTEAYMKERLGNGLPW